MTPRKVQIRRVCDVEDLARLAKYRRSVSLPTQLSTGRRKPAAFVLSMPARTVLEYIRRGIFTSVHPDDVPLSLNVEARSAARGNIYLQMTVKTAERVLLALRYGAPLPHYGRADAIDSVYKTIEAIDAALKTRPSK